MTRHPPISPLLPPPPLSLSVPPPPTRHNDLGRHRLAQRRPDGVQTVEKLREKRFLKSRAKIRQRARVAVDGNLLLPSGSNGLGPDPRIREIDRCILEHRHRQREPL